MQTTHGTPVRTRGSAVRLPLALFFALLSVVSVVVMPGVTHLRVISIETHGWVVSIVLMAAAAGCLVGELVARHRIR